jgi:hypothetical protein
MKRDQVLLVLGFSSVLAWLIHPSAQKGNSRKSTNNVPKLLI